MYYIKFLDMFRAILCSSSGGQKCIFTASGIVTLCKRLRGIKELGIKMVIKTSLYYDAQSEKHQNLTPCLLDILSTVVES
jgi:hypothetical protein